MKAAIECYSWYHGNVKILIDVKNLKEGYSK